MKNSTEITINDKPALSWLYIICATFIGINAVLIAYQFYWFTLLPAALLIFMLAFFSLDVLLYIVIFCTPLSISLKDTDFGVGLSVPTEPLLFGVMMMFFFRLLYEGKFDAKISRHPVTIAILFYFVWMIITTVTSSEPLISFKFLVAKMWFVISFYFLATQLFKKKENIRRFLWLYIIPFTIVIFYTLFNHALEGFKEQPAHVVMVPFYNDHTSYGAMLAMFIPALIALFFQSDYLRSRKLAAGLLLALFIVATVFSFTRAAWVSLVGALGCYIIYRYKIKWYIIAAGVVILFSFFFSFKDQIFMKLEKNKQASSADLAEHLQSISNISNDASNLERINRWAAALRMFEERPLLGWGPGTYQFKYAPFQFSSEHTSISTNAGDRGNAHSEYIGPMAEQGVIGVLCFLIVCVTAIYTGARVYLNCENKNLRSLNLAVLLGLITYLIHGTLNNFLDTDKASAPFWGFIAIMVTLDAYYTNREKLNDVAAE